MRWEEGGLCLTLKTEPGEHVLPRSSKGVLKWVSGYEGAIRAHLGNEKTKDTSSSNSHK